MVDISGKVTDKDGNGVENVNVTVLDESDNTVVATTTTDANGDYSVTVGTNSYHVMFRYEDSEGDLFNSESYPFVT